MDIIVVTTAETDEEARELLTQMGMPFAHKGGKRLSWLKYDFKAAAEARNSLP